MLHFTPVILKNMFSQSATRLYPLQKRPAFPNVRGSLEIKIEECKLCSLCAKKCPVGCIQVDKKSKQWILDPLACVGCAICVDTCPAHCLYFKSEYRTPTPEKYLKTFTQPEKPKEEKKEQK